MGVEDCGEKASVVSQHFKAEQQPVLLILGDGLLRQPTGAKVDDGIDDHQAHIAVHLFCFISSLTSLSHQLLR